MRRSSGAVASVAPRAYGCAARKPRRSPRVWPVWRHARSPAGACPKKSVSYPPRERRRHYPQRRKSRFLRRPQRRVGGRRKSALHPSPPRCRLGGTGSRRARRQSRCADCGTRLLRRRRGVLERFRTERFHDYAQQSTKILTAALPIDEPAVGGRAIDWRGVAIETLDTPGYTEAPCRTWSSWREADRLHRRFDLRRRPHLRSLQPAGRHRRNRNPRLPRLCRAGGRRPASLRKLAAREPDILIPARGPPIHDPAAAVEALIDRLERLFAAYFQTDALRWYWGEDNLRKRARRVLGERRIEWMPLATRIRQTPPRWCASSVRRGCSFPTAARRS